MNINASDGTNLILLRSKNGMSTGWDAYFRGSIDDDIYDSTIVHGIMIATPNAVVWDGTKVKYYCDGKYIKENFNAGNLITLDHISLSLMKLILVLLIWVWITILLVCNGF